VGYGGNLTEESKHDTKRTKREGGLIFVGSCEKCAGTVVKKKRIQTSDTTKKKARQCNAGPVNATRRNEGKEEKPISLMGLNRRQRRITEEEKR
jgi:hypothetical protein